ncbi:Telomerase protein component 1, partial [Perkinsus olseni]
DSRYFATGGTDSRICVWESTNTGMPIASWLAHVKSISSLGFSDRDASRLVSVSNDSTIAVWDALTGHLRCRLAGHVGNITCVEVCPMNDNLIATAGEDCSVRLWSLRDLAVDEAYASRTSDRGYNMRHHILKGPQKVPTEYHVPGSRPLALNTYKAMQEEAKVKGYSTGPPTLRDRARNSVLIAVDRAREGFSFLIRKAIEMGQGGNDSTIEKYKMENEKMEGEGASEKNSEEGQLSASSPAEGSPPTEKATDAD